MNIAFFIAHPSQFYMFREVANRLKKKHIIILIYFDKDVINDLVEDNSDSIETFKITSSGKGKLLNAAQNFLIKTFQLIKIIKKREIDLIVGSSITIAHASMLTNAKSIIFTEDDVEVIQMSARIGYPFCDHIVAPEVCNLGKWKKKGIRYQGFQKLAYLHPSYYKPKNINEIEGFSFDDNFYLLRFSGLSAHHDIGIKGINNSLASKIIDILKKKGKVFISSERELPENFEEYRINIKPSDIHSVLNHSQLFISDSQSMSVEASILGVPSIRISDFSGRISVLEELEKKYGLTYGFKSHETDKILNKMNELLDQPNKKKIFRNRRDIMLNDKIDVTSFMTDLIGHYPESLKQYYQHNE